jgi:uncharacterized protein YjbJ (UPF0337 family)
MEMEHDMSRLQKKAEARTKQIVGQMIGDDRLVNEGKEEESHAGDERHGEQRQDDTRKRE